MATKNRESIGCEKKRKVRQGGAREDSCPFWLKIKFEDLQGGQSGEKGEMEDAEI